MEKKPENIIDGEALSDSEQLKGEAPMEAKKLMEEIDGYEEMSDSEKVNALKGLLPELVDDNENRFIADVIANHIAVTETHAKFTADMEKLGQPANDNKAPQSVAA